MICVLGDIHFNSSKDYMMKTCERFLDWYKTWNLNVPQNTLILAGDLVHSAVNGGIVIHFLEEFASNSRFKEVHIVVGNHDKKKVDGINQLAYEFFLQKKNFKIYSKPEVVTIEDKKTLMLPYFVCVNNSGKTMSQYYSEITEYFDNDNDIIVGHFSGEECSFYGSSDLVYNLDTLRGKLCLGHIHTRQLNPNRYLGSVFAGRNNENDSTRAVWVFDGDDFREELLPIFNEFLYVTYPNPLPKSSAEVPIYTVLNCSSEETARNLYGDIYIRKVTKDLVERSSTRKEDLEKQFDSTKNFDVKELFENFLKTQDFNDGVTHKCREALSALIK